MLRKALLVAADAWATIQVISEQALPDEAGGILVGYRAGSDIVVGRAVEVPDVRASRQGYVRRQTEAQKLLDEVLDAEPRSSILGWVGDFHSHPADRPPSPLDRRTLRQNARADRRALAMLVAVHQQDRWRPFGYVSGGWWTREAAVIIPNGSEVPVDEDEP